MPATDEEVVMVEPALLVVVMATSTLADAEAAKREVVSSATLPAESVLEITVGMRTPVSVVPAAESVPEEMAAGVLTMVDPSEVVVTGEGLEAAISEDATTEDSMVLPAELVVVTGIVVGAMEEA